MTDGCRYCGGPVEPSKNPARPRFFCTNAHRAAFRLRERNEAMITARTQLSDIGDELGRMKAIVDDKVDVLDRLISQPRAAKPTP